MLHFLENLRNEAVDLHLQLDVVTEVLPLVVVKESLLFLLCFYIYTVVKKMHGATPKRLD